MLRPAFLLQAAESYINGQKGDTRELFENNSIIGSEVGGSRIYKGGHTVASKKDHLSQYGHMIIDDRPCAVIAPPRRHCVKEAFDMALEFGGHSSD